MTVHKTKSLVETYRAKAMAKDINELTGRTGRADLTQFVISQIASKVPVNANSILVDIGCGDGLLLLKSADNGLNGFEGRLIGILPTTEEVSRVRDHLLKTNNSSHLISIELGMAEKTSLPDNYCDILVCNSVLHGGGQNIENVQLSLREFYRITKPGGKIFIGEMPETNELEGKDYGSSIISWLVWVLKNEGFKSFWIRFKQTVPTFFSSEPFVIAPKNMFFMSPARFTELLNRYGVEVTEHYRHKEIDSNGIICDSKTRWNYIGIKR
jgi:ubiquinone/menaquinone biosynthesis C-methylase UbiE